ncbi:MAG: hypothetical protein HYS04_03845 [Acidobacteria bacterium]|nr:hypothetical protein [Acidobacteriota bacterium]
MAKQALTFVVGALLASGLVYFVIKRQQPAPLPEVQTASAPAEQPGQPAAQPAATAEPVTPPAAVAPSPVSRPEPAPRRKTSRREVAPAPKPAEKPSPSEPQAVAQNQTPAAPDAGPPAPPPRSVEMPGPPTGNTVQEAPKPEPRKAQTVTIPAGTLVSVRVDQAISSEHNQPGDSFRASLDAPLVIEGFVVAERGARVQGRVAEVDKGGRVRGLAQLALELTSITTADGQRVNIKTETFSRQAERERGRDAAKVGAAAGIGAAIGAIAGGGKGAAIGAAVGGAAGTGGVMATRGKAAELPAETRVRFRLAQPVTITEKL